jgi:hypothetical protein
VPHVAAQNPGQKNWPDAHLEPLLRQVGPEEVERVSGEGGDPRDEAVRPAPRRLAWARAARSLRERACRVPRLRSRCAAAVQDAGRAVTLRRRASSL